MRSRLTRFAALVAALALVGCSDSGGTATVSGEATYAGQPIESGSIQFTSKSGKGAVAGGAITAGKYSVSNVPLGEVVVSVTPSAPAAGPMTSDEFAKASADEAAAKKKGGASKSASFPADAGGNMVTFEVKAGANTLKIELTAPRPR